MLMNHTMANKVSWKEKIGWGLGGWADNYTFNVVLILFLYIYVDFFGMDPVLAGIGLAVPRLFDAITDPIIGNWSDNFRSPWGRRRPLIVIGALLCGLLLPFHWTPPLLDTVKNPWYANGPFLFFCLWGCLYAMAYTVFVVPFTALGFELSDDYEERTRVLCWRRYLGLCGQFFTPLVYTFVNPRLFKDIQQGAIVTSSVAGAVVILLGIMPALCCKENPRGLATQKKPSVFTSLKSAFGNFPFLLQLLGQMTHIIICGAGSGVAGLLTLHYICRGDAEFNGKIQFLTGTMGSVISMFSLFFMIRLAKRVGKRSGWFTGMAINILAYLTLIFTYTPKWPYAHLFSMVLIYLSNQGCGLMLDSMCSDICEYEEYRTGRRAEGMLSSLRGFIAKTSNAICGITCGLTLKFCGYSPELLAQGEIPWNILMKMKTLYITLPILGLAVTMAIFLFYPLSKEKMAEIHAALEKREREKAQA